MVALALSTHESNTTTNICAFLKGFRFPPKLWSLGGMGFAGLQVCGYDGI